ncbi:MAG: hypothetical protein NVS1B13_22610 [Flavisolibacter sp.]
MKKIPVSGKVYLVGAGPGDPELLTLKAVKYLQKADVILTDRLVSEEIIKEHAGDQTEIVYVGKQCRKEHSTAQQSINQLLINYASKGKQVVRLKGGDVSIFSNILDELETLVAHNIPYEIVPGITAASGAAAYCGIPLTARNYSTAVRFLTNYKSGTGSEQYWRDLAGTDDTLVFYMSSETIEDVIKELSFHKIDTNKLIAVVEQATTPLQQVYISNLQEFSVFAKKKKFLSPALVIIGKVVQLQEKFNWLPAASGTGEYFKGPPKAISLTNKSKRA